NEDFNLRNAEVGISSWRTYNLKTIPFLAGLYDLNKDTMGRVRILLGLTELRPDQLKIDTDKQFPQIQAAVGKLFADVDAKIPKDPSDPAINKLVPRDLREIRQVLDRIKDFPLLVPETQRPGVEASFQANEANLNILEQKERGLVFGMARTDLGSGETPDPAIALPSKASTMQPEQAKIAATIAAERLINVLSQKLDVRSPRKIVPTLRPYLDAYFTYYLGTTLSLLSA